MNGARWFFSFLVLLLAPQLASAENLSTPHVYVDLISEASSLSADSTIWVGLRFLIEKDWHLYWKNPGDSGEAPRVVWHLPSWIEPGNIQWPTPSRIPVGPLVNYGYDNQLLLIVPLKVGKILEKTDSLKLLADVKWLVCRDSCIPGKASVSLTLPISTAPSTLSSFAPLFQKTRTLLPQLLPVDWKISAKQEQNSIKILVKTGRIAGSSIPPNTFFFPFESNQIENAAPQKMTPTPQGFELDLKKSDQLVGLPTYLPGVLSVGGLGFEIHPECRSDENLNLAFLVSLLMAFLGGLILNVMPCVFPVLSLKAIQLLEQFKDQPRFASIHGLVYTAGILVSFWAFAITMLVVRSGGESLGWGFQLQSPAFVGVLASLLFMMAIQLLGVFELGSSLMGIGSRTASRENYTGSFVTGVLATVVATPCTAPFMGTAMAYAMTQPGWVVVCVFTSLGLGLAAPFCVLSFLPKLAKYLPRPGRWMETFKQAMAFPLFATVIWLAWVYGIQTGAGGISRVLTGFLFLGMAGWFLGRWASLWSRIAALVCVLVALWLAVSPQSSNPLVTQSSDAQVWQSFSRAKVFELTRSGKPVFLDFTAAWCVTCQVNERVAFTSEVMEEMKRRGITPIRADWTRGDSEITKTLEEFHRNGVPLYILISGKAGDSPYVLPQILTPQIVLDSLNEVH